MSPQRGMAESMDYMPAYRMPARWPSMIGTLAASPHEPLRVQVFDLYHVMCPLFKWQLLANWSCVHVTRILCQFLLLHRCGPARIRQARDPATGVSRCSWMPSGLLLW